ncbi:Clp protease N-terminal domain-containing protein [Geodermatophilus sp. CPCC 206100]|uniref:Clp protease N-terminal domain-containing protein n=1 Tax=Geodermatophilus sp. CPCC 206100 TaxID=3020054 RepID=UPI003B002371
MFERFTPRAREVVVGAQTEARELRHGRIGTEHLLLALTRPSDTPTARVLARHGLTHAVVVEAVRTLTGAEDLDAAALTTLGIDLDAVREAVEASFGPGALDAPERRARGDAGHIPFSPRAKKVLELALREAIALKSRSITEVHLALGLLREGQGLAMKVLHDRGIDAVDLRSDLVTTLGD